MIPFEGDVQKEEDTKRPGTSIHVPGLNVLHDDPAVSRVIGGGETLEVLASGTEAMLTRPCVDCGLITGRFCDYCVAADRVPDEDWAHGQLTPLCSKCDNVHNACHFCRGLRWCRPPKWKPGSTQVMYLPGPEIAPRYSAQIQHDPAVHARQVQRGHLDAVQEDPQISPHHRDNERGSMRHYM